MGSSELGPTPPWAAAATAAILGAGVFIASMLFDVDGPLWLTVSGAGVLVAALVFMVLPFRDLRHYGSPPPGAPYYATTRLVEQGIYRIVRHPQYLGYALLVLGFAAVTPHWAVIGLALGSAVFFYLQALQEEAFCIDRFGDAYRDYARRVPRFNALTGLWRLWRS